MAKGRNEFWISIECEECNGEGQYEIGPECSRPASSCCGGCYRDVECEECNGEGYHHGAWDVDDVQSLVDVIFAEGASISEARNHVKELIQLNKG